ncbi:MAG: C39 family peptidase [Anaerolineae bacterium]|nr:C39 family peptidase [Anaerolineae bacterium]
MFKSFAAGLLTLLSAAMMAGGALAQSAVPASWHLNGITHIYQGWNNCGPATLTMGLTYYGYDADQYPAAQWLKPNAEDKNVSPWQMLEYVNTQVGGTVYALERQGGTLDRLKQLIASNFPVLIEEGYDPPGENLGWMGHYLLISGYDDAAQQFTTQDSYKGPNMVYSYDHITEYWKHFNHLYIVLYDKSREGELMTLLGSDADPNQNNYNALVQATQDAQANAQDAFAWFNVGTNYVALGDFEKAAAAYDIARNLGLPWRMMWYQFGPFEAYYRMGRFDDMLALADANLNDGGGQYVEETFYYGGLAREGLGQNDRAINNFNGAISFNPNFTPARAARDALLAKSG